MAGAPQFLVLKESRDSGHLVELWVRRGVLAAIALLALLALLNVFGQRPVTSSAGGGEATLAVTAPSKLRGGVFYMGRFEIGAEEAIDDATLVLDPGWLESMHVNTIEPAPVEELGRDGRLALSFGPVAAGETAVVYLQLQVNPTNVGRRSQDVELRDGDRLLARVDRTVTIYP
jgi:hypothetical protein